ncbi:hypothetical protein BJF85_02360 [Saccharomonospora sp. CUA-673]|nr:hypothetical protein BJF85_02360 [Saccharomonospora sp. CUA-673]
MPTGGRPSATARSIASTVDSSAPASVNCSRTERHCNRTRSAPSSVSCEASKHADANGPSVASTSCNSLLCMSLLPSPERR